MEETSSRVSLGWRREENRPRQAHGIVGAHRQGIFFAAQMRWALDVISGHGGGHFGGEALADALDVGGGRAPVQQENSRNSATVQFLMLP